MQNFYYDTIYSQRRCIDPYLHRLYNICTFFLSQYYKVIARMRAHMKGILTNIYSQYFFGLAKALIPDFSPRTKTLIWGSWQMYEHSKKCNSVYHISFDSQFYNKGTIFHRLLS
jgi:hypothetical protein